MLKKMTKGLKNCDLVIAIKEIENSMDTGKLKQQGIVRSLHSEYENKTGSKQVISETEKAILLEASNRFITNLR